MKKFIFFLLLANISKAQYFNISQNFSPLNAKQYLKGNVKCVKRFFYTLTNLDSSQQGRSDVVKIENQDYYYGGFNRDSFDIEGHLLIRKTFNQNSKLLNIERYEYNSFFKLCSIKLITDSSSIITFDGTYNSLNLEKELLAYNTNGSLESKEIFYYKSNNSLDYVERNDYTKNIITQEYYSIKDGLKIKVIKSINNKLIAKEIFNSDDSSLYIYYRNYNKDFDVVKVAEQRLLKHDFIMYKNFVKCFNDNCFGYDIIAMDIKRNSIGDVTFIKQFNKAKNSSWNEEFEYKYDTIGNIIEKKFSNYLGNKYRIARFEFEYY